MQKLLDQALTDVFTPRRGRPTARQSAAIERAIREAATQAFLANGYERTGMEAIAAQAGVPKSTLYKRFPDKRALLRAVLREQVTAWCELERTPVLQEDLGSRLKQLAADILRQAMAPEVQSFWALASSAWSAPEDAAERQEAIGYTKMVSGIADEIRQFGPASGVRAADPEQAAKALMAMLGGWIAYAALDGPEREEEAERFAHAAVDMLMRGTDAW